jgi:VCBS repeat-containing protein
MKQENGSVLLGVNDPRAPEIGIITVAAIDDRQSVLAAILTQDKLRRKQIAIVLPNPNKAFQRPNDFDALKKLRRELRAQLVFIAQSGPGPAEFARQRRFTVYSTLDSYRQALLNEEGAATSNQPDPASSVRQGNRQYGAAANAGRNGRNVPDDEDEDSSTSILGAGAAGAALGGAAGFAAGQAMRGANGQAGTQRMHSPDDDIDDDDVLPPLPPSTGAGSAPYAYANGNSRRGAGPDQDDDDDAHDPGPPIINLPTPTRTTGKLGSPPANARASATASTSTPARKRNSGKIGGAAAVAGAAGAAAGVGVSRAGGIANPPTRGSSGNRGGGSNRPPGRRFFVIGALVVLVISTVVCASFAFAQPNLISSITQRGNGSGTQATSPATVTITPDSHLVSNSYIVTGVSGNPDSTRLQISARQLNTTAQSGAIMVNATGHAQTNPIQATGKLTFYNALTAPQAVARGTIFTLANGVEVTNDTLAMIPAANPPTEGLVTVSAHAITSGTAGNIKALAVNRACCVTGVTVQNTQPFTGGQDAKNYNFVTQADVNGAANGQRTTIAQQAANKLRQQIAQGETLVASPQCTTSVKADQVGDKGFNVSSTTAVVSASCSAQVYNLTQLQTLMKSQLQGIADKNYGPGYVLAGNVAINARVQQAADGAAGTLRLLTDAKGMWYYNITQQREAALAKLIAGKTVNDAVVRLQGEKGIGKATIQINGGGNTLPTDSTQIGFVVEPITGLSATITPVSSTPTITNGGTGNGSSATPAIVGGG